MNQVAHQLFIKLHDHLRICSKQINCLARHKCGYTIAKKYWYRLKAVLIEHQFNHIKDEIFFFKEIKPLFTGEIAYRKLVVDCLRCLPPANQIDSRLQYWQKQLKRFSDFRNRYDWFCAYYEQGESTMDENWFMRRPTSHPVVRTTTRHDHLISRYLALKKFTIYAQMKHDKLFSSGSLDENTT